MMIIFELSINALENIIMLDFFNRYFGFRTYAPRRYVLLVVAFFALFLQITLFNHQLPLSNAGTYLAVILLFVYARMNLCGAPAIQFFIAVFLMALISLIANGISLLLGSILNHTPSLIVTEFGTIRVLAVLLSKCLLFFSTRLFLRIKWKSNLTHGDTIPLILIPMISLYGITLMRRTVFADSTLKLQILYAMLCILAINLITYYLFARLSRENRNKIEYMMLRQQYDYAQQNAVQISAMYREMRSFRHDIKNHMYSLGVLLDRGDTVQARQFAQELFQKQAALSYHVVTTDNEVLNAVLGIKMITCREEHISVLLNIQNTLQWISPADLSTLMANLMDNAIESCRQVNEGSIVLEIVPQEAYVSISLANSIPRPVLATNPHLHTTKGKKGERGLGVNNIRKIVSIYHGIIEYRENDDVLVCDILIQNPAK